MPLDRDDEIENGKSRGTLSDMMKKALFASIGAVFMTEESVRSYVSDAKLPREIRNYLIQNAAQAKEQFFDYVSKELSQVVLRSDLPKVIQRFLADHTIELEAKIRFRSNGTPDVSGAARAVAAAPAPPAGAAIATSSVPAQAAAPLPSLPPTYTPVSGGASPLGGQVPPPAPSPSATLRDLGELPES
jgi:hypothetical protein